jgi:hypothetical protein
MPRGWPIWGVAVAGRLIGVGLDAEDERHVAWYERWGYNVMSEAELEGLRLRSLFRPRPTSPGTHPRPWPGSLAQPRS